MTTLCKKLNHLTYKKIMSNEMINCKQKTPPSITKILLSNSKKLLVAWLQKRKVI
jgi:hypothetical protein